MIRPALYPFLFVILIVFSPLAYNLVQLDPSLAVRPLILLLLVSVVAAILFYLLFRDWQYDCYLIFLISLYIFGFGYLNRLIQNQLASIGRTFDEQILLALFTGLLGILAIKKVWDRLGGRTWLTPYLNLVIGLWLLFPAFELISGSVLKQAMAKEVTLSLQDEIGEITVDCTNGPDSYYIILDGYGRKDMLADLYDLDTGPFMEFLEKRGFYIAGQSYTNYIQTIFSIPSALNFNFIDPPEDAEASQAYISGLVRQNEIMATLKRCDYTTIAIESGFIFTNHPEVDLYLERGVGANEFESLLLADSPIDVLADDLNLEPSEHSYAAHRERVLYSFETLQEIPQIPGPKFIFAHILSPHPPFVFDQDGSPLDPPRPYYLGDGDDYQGSLEEYLTGYAQQAQFVNRNLEQTIQAILANSPAPPIIIIQGDHGPGSRLVWEQPEQTCLWERTPILNAYYFPRGKTERLYPSISPVNTFRVVLNTFFGTDLPLLPDTTYFTSHRIEEEAIDIRGERASRANCAPR